MDKEDVRQTGRQTDDRDDGILINHEKEGNPAIYNDMDGP